MKRIDELTAEQKAKFGEWTKKWVDIGISTEPADFEAAAKAALKAYKLCNLGKPMVVLRVGSPYAATVGGAIAWQMLKSMGATDLKVGAQVWAQVWDQVRDQVWAQVGAESFQVAKDGLHNEGASNIGWAGFASWVSYFRDVCGFENEVLKKFEITETLVKSCGWTWWHQNVLAISDRPELIKRDNEGRLHCEAGPSIAYRDGWRLFHWHGVSIPGEWVTGKKPSAKDALTWKNVEQRRAACELVGWASILDQLKAKTIDKHLNDEIGSLIEVELPDSGKQRFLSVVCGTGRRFAIPVDNSLKTAQQASAWTYGLDPAEYEPEVRT